MKWGAILSINLGIMNLLPIPALDGGRLMFFAVEAVRGKPIDRQKEGMVHYWICPADAVDADRNLE
jgi:regulator of sigma E protease